MEEEITKASLLQSKAKMMADRNERFAVVKDEVKELKEKILDNIEELSNKIKNVIDS